MENMIQEVLYYNNQCTAGKEIIIRKDEYGIINYSMLYANYDGEIWGEDLTKDELKYMLMRAGIM